MNTSAARKAFNETVLGRLVLKDGKYVLNGHPFTHAIFLNPKYATKKTYAFLNAAHAAKFDFTLNGVRHRGTHTGVYAWRNGKVVYATPK